MKTNHRRNYKDDSDPNWTPFGDYSRKLETKGVATHVHSGFCNGHRGMARARRGAKNRLRTLERQEGKDIVRQELQEL